MRPRDGAVNSTRREHMPGSLMRAAGLLVLVGLPTAGVCVDVVRVTVT